MDKIRVGIVNYLNTRPLLYGIEQANNLEQVELIQDYPSNIARFLLEGTIDVGLVPVAAIPSMKEHHIITNYCIGCNGPVASVALFSEVPIKEIKEVLLDYQSRTSVALARFLLKEHWKVSPLLTDTNEDFRSRIKGTTAGVIIGDRALQQRSVSPYIYDLGEAWKQLTGLPFVFAAWVSNKKLPDEFVEAFNAANRVGVNSIEMVVKQNSYPFFNLQEYYTKYIDYHLDMLKRDALKFFLRKLS